MGDIGPFKACEQEEIKESLPVSVIGYGMIHDQSYPESDILRRLETVRYDEK